MSSLFADQPWVNSVKLGEFLMWLAPAVVLILAIGWVGYSGLRRLLGSLMRLVFRRHRRTEGPAIRPPAPTDYDRQLAQLREAVRLFPDEAKNYKNLAWLLATCPRDELRNGPEAVAAATKACDMTQGSVRGYLDTLAAAYAEAGRFDEAIRQQEELLERPDLPRETQEAYRARLELYRSGKAYRET